MNNSRFEHTQDQGLVRKPLRKNPFYKTTNQDYNPTWELTQDCSIKDYTVPTFKEILDKKYPKMPPYT